MFKKNQQLTFSSTGNPFQEVYNMLTYRSTTSTLSKLTLTPITEAKKLYFIGERIVYIPFLQKISSMFPEEIRLKIRGNIDSTGKAEILYELPEEYKDYVLGQERIRISPNDNTGKASISVQLLYTIVESEGSGSIFDSIKNRAYSSMISAAESHVMLLYSSKRGMVFGQPCPHKIETIEDLARVLE